MPRPVLLLLVVVGVAVALPARAPGGCVPAVVVGRTLLLGQLAPPRGLPPRAGERDAVYPACNDAGQGEPDGRGTVIALRGVPADVAALSPDGDILFVVPGSLTALGAHPLHGIQPRRPSVRHACGRPLTLRGSVRYPGPYGFALRSAGRDIAIEVDARGRIVNRPATQPLVEGQRLKVDAVRCRHHVVADRIAFVGPTLHPEPYPQSRLDAAVDGSPFPWPWVILGAVGVGTTAVVARGRSPDAKLHAAVILVVLVAVGLVVAVIRARTG